jgi:hypothetical protein
MFNHTSFKNSFKFSFELKHLKIIFILLSYVASYIIPNSSLSRYLTFVNLL